jgi:hypothetical protein
LKRHLSLLLVLCAPVACLQKLESSAADNTQPRLDAAPPPTTSTATPDIELDEEGKRTTTDPCIPTSEQALAILTKNCAGCHGGGPEASQGQPPFDCVLDFDKLKMRSSESVKDPKNPTQNMRFIAPGDPDDSRLYVRIVHEEMPPKLPFGITKDYPRPTTSDISILREWINHCMGSSPPTPPGTGGAGGNGAAGGAGGAGGASGAGGAGGAPPTRDAGVGQDTAPPPTDSGVPPPANCGAAGQVCCPNNVCNMGFNCQGGGGGQVGRCVACGGMGQPCCGRGLVAQRTCTAPLTCQQLAGNNQPVCQ